VAEAAPAPAQPKPAQPKPAQPKPPAPPPVAEPDSGTYLLPGAALLVSLLGAAGLYIARRRKAKKPFEATLFHETAGDKTAQHASAAESAATMLGTGILAPAAHGLTEADPLAEADVYIAYGRDVQAEDILKEALRKQPDRHPVRVKLLSIYAGRKDLQSFETFARELHGMTQGEGEDWKQAAELGREIDPGNPLYAASRKEPVHTPAPVPEPELVIERRTTWISTWRA
jgi:pilus assembly protein FimV